MHYSDSVQKCRDATSKNNQGTTPFCRAAGLCRPRREIGSDLKGTSNFASQKHTPRRTHTHTNEKIRYEQKYKSRVLLFLPFAWVFAEDQLLNVLFSRTRFNLWAPLITVLHRPKEQRSTITKSKENDHRTLQGQQSPNKTWTVDDKSGTSFQQDKLRLCKTINLKCFLWYF